MAEAAPQSTNIAGEIRSQFRSFYDKISARQRWILLGVVSVVLITLSVIVYLSQQTTWVSLFNGLGPKEMSQILKRLDEVQIKYQITPGGTGVLVPTEFADKAKLDIANSDVLSGGIVGLEIFDRGSFTMTEFQQNVQLRRAMEGELARLIMQINLVDSAKVILAIPEKSVFIKDSDKPTAAVHLVLKSNSPLDSKIVKTILNLVASGVPGLITSNVKISDQYGNLYSYDLADSKYDDENKNFQYKYNIEKYLENKVLDQLQQVAGNNGIKVKISAEINNEVQNIEENLLDPDLTAVVSEQTIQEKSSGGSNNPTGVPGVSSNSPEINTGVGELGSSSSLDKKTKQTNYENSRRLIKREVASGDIKRLTVSVLLDDKTEVTQDANGNSQANRRPWQPAELQQVSAIVQNAVGFSSTRGDQIEVRNIAFATYQQEQVKINQETGILQKEFIFNLLRYAIAGIVTLLLILLVVRPLINRIAPKADAAKLQTLVSGRVADVEDEELELPTSALATNKAPSPQQIIDFARDNPELTTVTVKSWLKEA